MDPEDVSAAVLKSLAGAGGYSEPWDVAQGFVHAVSWEKETWLQALIAFHVLLWAIAFLSRHHSASQAVLFVVVSGLVASAETANRIAAKHWRRFSTQNYFDEHGVFAGVAFAGPLLLLLLLIMLNLVRLASNLLVDVKRRELRAKVKKAQ